MTYDPKSDKVYYAFRHTTTTESISRFSRTEGPKGPGQDEASLGIIRLGGLF